MKTVKRILSVFLAASLALGGLSIMASAAVEGSWTGAVYFYREDGEGNWVRTQKAKRGENVVGRFYLEADYAVGPPQLMLVCDKNQFTFSGRGMTRPAAVLNNDQSENVMWNFTTNEDPASTAAKAGWHFDGSADDHVWSECAADEMTYTDEDLEMYVAPFPASFFNDKIWFYPGSIASYCVIPKFTLNGCADNWILEIPLEVKADAKASEKENTKSLMYLPVCTLAHPTDAWSGRGCYTTFPKNPLGENADQSGCLSAMLNEYTGNESNDPLQYISFDNKVTLMKSAADAAESGKVGEWRDANIVGDSQELWGYIDEPLTNGVQTEERPDPEQQTIPEPKPAASVLAQHPTWTFKGWIPEGAPAGTEPILSRDLKAGYEPTTYYPDFGPGDSSVVSYVPNIYQMDDQGNYPATPTLTLPAVTKTAGGADLTAGTQIIPKDAPLSNPDAANPYTVPTGFVYDDAGKATENAAVLNLTANGNDPLNIYLARTAAVSIDGNAYKINGHDPIVGTPITLSEPAPTPAGHEHQTFRNYINGAGSNVAFSDTGSTAGGMAFNVPAGGAAVVAHYSDWAATINYHINDGVVGEEIEKLNVACSYSPDGFPAPGDITTVNGFSRHLCAAPNPGSGVDLGGAVIPGERIIDGKWYSDAARSSEYDFSRAWTAEDDGKSIDVYAWTEAAAVFVKDGALAGDCRMVAVGGTTPADSNPPTLPVEGYPNAGWAPATGGIMTSAGQTFTYAPGDPASYNVTFYSWSCCAEDAADELQTDPVPTAYGQAIDAPAAAYYEGYLDPTWYVWTGDGAPDKAVFTAAPGEGAQTLADFPTMPARDLKFYAYYGEPDSFTITFDSNAPAGEVSNMPAEITLDYGATVPAPSVVPARNGYTFAGWEPAVPATMPASDTTCVAQWTIESHTITFAPGAPEGEVSNMPADITLEYSATVPAPSVVPTRTGYTFAGWDPAVPATMPAENMTCVAQWTIERHTITFAPGAPAEEVSDMPADITLDYGAAVTAPAVDPKRTGYDFAGWTPEVPATMPEIDTTCVAQWTPAAVTITFDSNGGSAVEPINGRYNDAVTAPEPPTKTGFDFAGWEPAVPETMPAENMTCVAKWTPVNYTITFNSNGGGNVAPITGHYGDAVAAPADPERDGYTFGGWYDDATLANPYSFATMPAENITLYAKWTGNPFQITFAPGAPADEVTNMPETINAICGEAIVEPAETPERAGFNFGGWDPPVPETMPAGGLNCVAQWVTGDQASYNIEIYMMDSHGVYPEHPASITTARAAIGTVQTIEPGILNGYTVDRGDPNAAPPVPDPCVLSARIEATGTVLKVYYARNKYELTYEPNLAGTTLDPSFANPAQVYFDAPLPVPAAPAKAGYEFLGWFKANDDAAPANMPAEDLTLYGHWEEKTYTITYYANGELLDTQTLRLGETIPAAPEVDAPGMRFVEWSYNPTDFPGEGNPMTENNYTATARLQSATYTVTFLDDLAANGGNSFTTFTVTAGSAIPVPSGTPAKQYYHFLNWIDVPAVMPEEDLTIEPNFERDPIELIPKAGSTTLIDRENKIITGLDTMMDEDRYNDFLDVSGPGYFTVVNHRHYGTGTQIELRDLDTREIVQKEIEDPDNPGSTIMVDEVYTVVIYGDLDGNSVVNAADKSIARDEVDHITSWSNPNASDYNRYRTMAADVDDFHDGRIRMNDVGVISEASLNGAQIDQVTGKASR